MAWAKGAEVTRDGRDPADVPLDGVLAEFRDGLVAEIEAARRTAQSSAVQLVHGERIGRVADRHQYLFRLESPQMVLPDDLPGDLYVPGRERVDATVISMAASAITLSVEADLGSHVPRASLSSNLTNLLRALITRIEAIAQADRPNRGGARLLGEEAVSGEPLTDLSVEGLNGEQLAAVASGLGRDTTFIQGPPGTGKTKTIGALGEQLARANRAVLLVSHTNTAVDQALLHIAKALGPEMAEQGKILRLGEPKDERVSAQPNLLVPTHVARLSAELVAEREALTAERSDHLDQLLRLQALVALCEWAVGASERQDDRERRLVDLRQLGGRLEQLKDELGAEEERIAEWEVLRSTAQSAQARFVERPGLSSALEAAQQRLAAARVARAAAETDLLGEAEELRERVLRETQLLVANARDVVDAAIEQRGRGAQTLDQARQKLLMSERYERLPSLEFARTEVERRQGNLVDAQGAERAAASELVSAEDLLRQSRDANAVTRRLRGLAKPEALEGAVEACRLKASGLRAEAVARSGELERAQEQLAETEQLRVELVQSVDVPTVERAEELLAEAENVLDSAQRSAEAAREKAAAMNHEAEISASDHVARGIAQAEATVGAAAQETDDASSSLASCERDIQAFEKQHGMTPARGLAEAGKALSQRDAMRLERDRSTRSLDAGLTVLRQRLESERHALLALGRDVQAAEDLNELSAALGPVVRAAVFEAEGQRPAELQEDMATRTVRVRAIDAEMATIDEQLAAVEATVIAQATVLATTLTKAYLRDEIQRRRFDTVILDEASMAPIPALWVAAAVADNNVVIVGDPHQLPPIAQAADDEDKEAPAYRWLARDIFEVSGVLDDAEHLVRLRTQYRMHPAISAAPNALEYDGLLRDDPSTLSDGNLDPWYRRDWGYDAPVLFVDTEKADAWCSTVAASGHPSRLNFLSATLATGLAERLLREERDRPPAGEARVIIATPYRPQARLLTLLIRDAGLEGEVVAGTVHSLQGSEAPVVIYDLVVDEPHRRAGLFSPKWDHDMRRQFNVGMTRARHRLFVVGDFKFLSANSKKAFLGRLLAQLSSAPRVDAELVLPLGLAARTAAAQAKAYGHNVETTTADRVVLTQRDFDDLFIPDLGAAEQRIVIYSPFLTHNRFDVVGPQLRAAVERGVSVYVVTKPLDERNKGDLAPYRELMRTLQRWGVIVVPKKAMHEKLVFIDEEVLWVGSLNPLSFRDTREVMERRRSLRVAEDYRKTLQLDIAFSAYEQGEVSCPICGSAMALAEGDRGAYRRCVISGCYSRGLNDPPLVEGKMSCHSCGGDLYYGSWGEKPAWRCRANAKHRMPLHRNHLKLPAMAARLTKTELSRLIKELGISEETSQPRPEGGQGSLFDP